MLWSSHFPCTPPVKPKTRLQRHWTPSLGCLLSPLPEARQLPRPFQPALLEPGDCPKGGDPHDSSSRIPSPAAIGNSGALWSGDWGSWCHEAAVTFSIAMHVSGCQHVCVSFKPH